MKSVQGGFLKNKYWRNNLKESKAQQKWRYAAASHLLFSSAYYPNRDLHVKKARPVKAGSHYRLKDLNAEKIPARW